MYRRGVSSPVAARVVAALAIPAAIVSASAGWIALRKARSPAQVPPPVAASIAPVATAPSAPSSSARQEGDGPARVVETAPSGVRVALDAPVVVRFDRAGPAEVKLVLDPPAEGQIAWPAPDTLTFSPARWAEGKTYHARVEAPSLAAPAAFEFRSLVPPPEHIEPGRGERLTLTFDDGADRPAQVVALLDLLQKEDVQAIFFPIGRWAENNPKLIERMVADGHRVCNHTYSHQNLRLPQLTDGEIRAEIARGAGAGTCPLLRPPLKAFDPRSEKIIASMGYTLYLWDIDSRDWEGAPAEDIVNLVLAKAHPGAVVLFHMHAEATLAALPLLLPRLKKAGYRLREPKDGKW